MCRCTAPKPCASMGYFTKKKNDSDLDESGDFFLTTNDKAPFCQKNF